MELRPETEIPGLYLTGEQMVLKNEVKTQDSMNRLHVD